MILLSYKFRLTRFFGDGEYENIYDLRVLKRFLWWEREVVISYTISMFGSIREYEEHWDKLIANKTKIKLNGKETNK